MRHLWDDFFSLFLYVNCIFGLLSSSTRRLAQFLQFHLSFFSSVPESQRHSCHHGWFFRSNWGENSSFSSTHGNSSSVEFGVSIWGDEGIWLVNLETVNGIDVSPMMIVGRSFCICCCSWSRQSCCFISCLSSFSLNSWSKRLLE